MIDKIKELRKEQQALSEKIDALEQELKQQESQSKWKPRMDELCKWKPRMNEPYYVANPISRCFCVEYAWSDDTIDEHRYNAGLVRQTAEEAAEVGKQMYYQRWFRNLSDVTEEMWMDVSASKYNVYYDWACLELCYDSRRVSMVGGAYFTSEEKLKQAIKTIGGEEILKRYVLGVE